jgi:hypothetical protein
MTRDQIENFQQDRQGNVEREIDPVRGQDGMDASTNDNGNPQGLLNIAAGDTGTDQILYELPDDADSVHIEEMHLHNSSSSDGSMTILEATLADDGTIDSTTERTVPFNVGTGVSRTIPYTGREISGDAIAVNSDSEGWVGVGIYTDKPEEYEPNAEQTASPS